MYTDLMGVKYPSLCGATSLDAYKLMYGLIIKVMYTALKGIQMFSMVSNLCICH